MEYRVEELIPVVATLAEKYTFKESTSVSYEIAQMLMEAVIYCLEINEKSQKDNLFLEAETLSVLQQYQEGYKIVINKIKQALKEYNHLNIIFDSYQNSNYENTFRNGILGFFRFYDPVFAPQDTMITMDYPTICEIKGKLGIEAIEQYIEYVGIEQKFLHFFPREEIVMVLSSFCKNYTNQYFNICKIYLRYILVKLILKNDNTIENDRYEGLRKMLLSQGKKEMKMQLGKNLKKITKEISRSDMKMYFYLSKDLNDFTDELYVGVKYFSLSKIVFVE